MPSLVTRHLRVFNAKQFLDSLKNQDREKIYLFVGYTQDWANNDSPPAPSDHVEEVDYNFWHYMLAAKKVNPADLSLVIPNYSWESNTVYRQYDSLDTNLFSTPSNSNTFYVVTSDNNVYKCLYNAQGTLSNTEPTGTTTTTTTTADGYIWKFMYTLSTAEAEKFKTTNYIPIKTILEDDSSAQWNVQEASTNGSIDVIVVDSGGANYSDDTDNPVDTSSTTITFGTGASAITDFYVGSTVYIAAGKGLGQLREVVDYSGSTRRATVNTSWTITPNTSSTYHVAPKIEIDGDGTGAQAYANVSAGVIQRITMISEGSNYAYANVSISANAGTGALAHAAISPPGGHGSDPVSELAAHNVMINVELTGNESNNITTLNDFRQVGLLANPLVANGNQANSSIYNQTTRLTLTSVSGSFVEDERVTSNTESAVGFVVDFANTNASSSEGILSIINTSNGSFTANQSITSNSGVTGVIDSVLPGDLKENIGDLLYLHNRSRIERSNNQIEDFNLTITF